jgi:DedD protein
MGLFSFLKRGERSRSGEAATAPSRSEVDQLRTRARRRLVGAMVLVVAAVVGFPLLFETQPRPLRADLPIQVSPRDTTVMVAPAPTPAPSRAAEPASALARNDTPPDHKHDEPASAASAPAAASAASATAMAAEPPPEPKPVNPVPAPAATRPAGDTARAQAALEGRDLPARQPKPAERPAPPSANRFVVQVGAFAEADTARDVRGRVEKLGLRTYTQEVDTGSGRRIRVRVGPFAEREQADRTAAKLKAAGLSAAVLTL